jgi:flagellar motility protein MotE (MotC chaperone)
MKNVLILGLLALLLFSVSATLSLWLNHPYAPAETNTAAAKAGRKTTREKSLLEESDHDPEALKPAARPKGHPCSEEVAPLAAQVGEQLSALKERENRLDRRQSQLDLILQDIRSERQSIDGLRRQAAAELKHLDEKVAELERKAGELEQQRQSVSKSTGELQRRQTEQDEGERKSFDRMGSTYDAMPAENTARILQQMADMGKLEMAAKVLAQMKERQAAKVLAEISDPALAAQLLEKMRTVKRTPPAAATGSPP